MHSYPNREVNYHIFENKGNCPVSPTYDFSDKFLHDEGVFLTLGLKVLSFSSKTRFLSHTNFHLCVIQ